MRSSLDLRCHPQHKHMCSTCRALLLTLQSSRALECTILDSHLELALCAARARAVMMTLEFILLNIAPAHCHEL